MQTPTKRKPNVLKALKAEPSGCLCQVPPRLQKKRKKACEGIPGLSKGASSKQTSTIRSYEGLWQGLSGLVGFDTISCSFLVRCFGEQCILSSVKEGPTTFFIAAARCP